MTTVLLALGNNTLRKACQSELGACGHTMLVLDRPLAALSLASMVRWDVLVVDDTSFGRDALRTAGGSGRVIGIGVSSAGVHEAVLLPLQSGRLRETVERVTERREGLMLDSGQRLARLGGKEERLTRIEYRLLETLYEHRPQDVALNDLLQEVWGTAAGMKTAELVRTHVRNLRQKLTRLDLPDAIRSHRGLGYALAP
jgi:hypothetical protein